MTRTYSCPKCGRDVMPKDINVVKDIMLCPSCGEVSIFSAVVERGRVLTVARGQGSYFFGVGPVGIRRRFAFDRRTKICRGFMSYTVGGGKHGGGHPLPELQLTHPDNANTVHVCAGMSEDALDYVEAVVRREISRV